MIKLQCENCGGDLELLDYLTAKYRCVGCGVSYLGSMPDYEPVHEEFCETMSAESGYKVGIYRQTRPSYNLLMVIDNEIQVSFGTNFNGKRLDLPAAIFFVSEFKKAVNYADGERKCYLCGETKKMKHFGLSPDDVSKRQFGCKVCLSSKGGFGVVI